jgi:hypothetical protein
MRNPANDDSDGKVLRETLHERLDQLSPSTLAAVDRALIQLEVDALRRDLDDCFGKDEAEGKLSAEKVDEAIPLHRVRHPYRG